MPYTALNRKPHPAAQRAWFFIDDAGRAYYSPVPDVTDAPALLDNRRAAALTHDGMTIPVGGDHRVLVGPGDMAIAAQACVAAGVRIFVSPSATDVADAAILAARCWITP